MTTADATADTGSPSLGDAFREWWTNVRSGQLGSLPIIIGLVIIAIVFQSQNDRFLTASNFVNLIVQSAAFATIAMGIVFVLLLGEIDLSVGYVSGVAGVIAAVLLIPDGNELSTPIAVALALGSGIAIGTLHGLIITKIGIPSFVVTLAGLIAWNGVVLLLIGSRGTVVLQNSFLIGLANDFLPESTSWALWLLAVLIFAGIQLNEVRVRRKAELGHDPFAVIGLRVAALAVALGAAVYVANQDRGIPYLFLLVGFFLLFWGFVLSRTRFGRYVYAVGGNAEAARRAGINVDRIRIAVFAICSFMAAVGGLVLASRLRSVDTNAGGGSILLYSIAAAVIGGTSLFGGVGHIKSAILGALVIASIDNGLGLLGLGSGEKFVITGGVLLLAVTVDSLSRRAQAHSGRA
ncbi:MAG: D-xylose transport system permease protein [Thermoleophilaceae bacterium]|nr:D-xylose transport system permease protein [Thermoleophilaceae bacterium]